jgi:asparagine synthase (glutamine-hydrolysing)
MCGIAGFVADRPGDGSEAVLRRMTDAIRHRGPDDSGYYCDGSAFLGHRRLSIVDLAGGHQPMCANMCDSGPEDSRGLWITYNGEVFNHAELRPILERAGHVYATRCDTETILHAYQEYGPACVTHFRGMFAFAIWDKSARTLFCARDRLGIKPFYYYWDGRLFAFASEIKALLEHPAISAVFEDSLLGEYLAFGYTSGDRTLFRSIRKLMPGHHLTASLSTGTPRLSIEQYWDVPERGYAEPADDDFWIAETRRRLEETVRMRLMSDVPLGMFLSGGVDSSAIAALIKRMAPGPVKTFAVGYREGAFSELDYAAEVARSIGTDHHSVVVGMEDFFQALPQLIWHEDEPIAWPSSVSLYFVARLAASEVKVVLTGEGSDELFGGYERYRWNQINQRGAAWLRVLPSPFRRALRSAVATSPLLSASLRRKLGHTCLGRDDSVESLFLDNFYAAFPAAEQERLGASTCDVYTQYLRYWSARPQGSLLERMLYADQKTYLIELLMKQDQMSMACSIESRVPFLDHTFVEFASRIPDHLKIRGSVQKYVLKKAVEDLLPAGIIHRKKMGFPTPLRQWLREARAERLFADLRSRDGFLADYLDLAQVDGLIERHRSGFEDATDRIWRLLNLQIWGQMFLGAAGEPSRLEASVRTGNALET